MWMAIHQYQDVNHLPYNKCSEMKYWIGLIGFCGLLLTSCASDINQRMKAKPSAFGPLNSITVIADQEDWEVLKDTLNFYFEAPYPLLPQPEPQFDLRHFSPANLVASDARRKLRTYLIISDQQDTSSASLKIVKNDVKTYSEYHGENDYSVKLARDKWAQNQLLIYLYGNSMENVKTAIAERYQAIINQIRDFEREALEKQTYITGENKLLSKQVQDTLGVAIRLPDQMQLAKISKDLAWLRMETPKASSSIIITRQSYTDQEQLSKEGLIEYRNQLTKKHVQGEKPGTYVVINDQDLPVLYGSVKLGRQNGYEIRGIWEMKGDFLGGPFVTYAILGPNLDSLYIVDIFVYAPGEEKRELLQSLEHIVSTLKVIPS